MKAEKRPPRLTTLKPRLQQPQGRLQGESKRFSDPNRGSRHERGYGTAWDKLRLVILERDCGLCQPCAALDRVTVGNIVDHKVPKAQGGSDDESNLQAICAACHKAKTQAESRGATWDGKQRQVIGRDGWPV